MQILAEGPGQQSTMVDEFPFPQALSWPEATPLLLEARVPYFRTIHDVAGIE